MRRAWIVTSALLLGVSGLAASGDPPANRTEPDADDVDNGRFGAGVSW